MVLSDMDERAKRIVKKPTRFLTTSSDEAPRKRSKGHKKLTEKDKDEVERDITELRNILNNENKTGSETDSSDSEIATNNPYKSLQHISERNVSKQSAQLLSQSNSGHLAQCSSNDNNVSACVQTPYQSIPNQTATQMYCTSSNPTQHIQYCAPMTSSTQMSYVQENTRNNHYPLPSSTEIPYNQVNISNNSSLLTQVPHRYQSTSNNNIQSQYTQNTPAWPQQNNSPQSNNHVNEVHSVLQSIDYNRFVERLDNESQLQRIYNAVVQNKKSKRPMAKPDVLPITSMEQMIAFNDIEQDTYIAVVRYYEFIGGFHIKEVVNMCLKEALADSITPYFTWWSNERKRSFSETRLVHAIYEAACNNVHFKSPSRFEFQKHMKEALRTSQERFRSRNKNKQQAVGISRNNRNYWNNNENSTSAENTEANTDE